MCEGSIFQHSQHGVKERQRQSPVSIDGLNAGSLFHHLQVSFLPLNLSLLLPRALFASGHLPLFQRAQQQSEDLTRRQRFFLTAVVAVNSAVEWRGFWKSRKWMLDKLAAAMSGGDGEKVTERVLCKEKTKGRGRCDGSMREGEG